MTNLIQIKHLLVFLIIIFVIGIFQLFRHQIFTQKSPQTTAVETSLPELQQTFEEIDAQTDWELQSPLIWGYYFYDHDKKRLSVLRDVLKEEGFEVYELRNSASDASQYLLYVYESKVHTPESLLSQYNHILMLAHTYEVEVFDGWEVGETPL